MLIRAVATFCLQILRADEITTPSLSYNLSPLSIIGGFGSVDAVNLCTDCKTKASALPRQLDHSGN